MRNFLLSGLVTILLVGTIFFRAPQGVSGWLAGIPAYLSGWTQPPEMPAIRLLVSIPIYQPLAVLFGIWGLFLGWFGRVRNAQALSLWFLVALLLALANPARQMSDLVWASIPLWGLAALTLSSVIWEPESQFAISLSQAALIFFLMALAGLNLAALGEMDPGVPGYATRFALIAGVLALGAVTTSLVGLGWSWLSARQGLVWGLTASFLAVTLSGLWGATQFRLPGRVDLLQPVPSSGDIDLLVKTVVDLSNWSTGEKNAVDLTLAVDSPALHWALRDYANLTILPATGLLPSGGSPSIVITPSDLVDPGLSASYRGQDFIYRTYPSWTGALPEPAIRWLAFGWASLQGEQVILWARVDLFPGGAAVSSNPSAGSRFPGANLP